VDATPKEFENRNFTLKTPLSNVFHPYSYTPQEFKTVTITGHFGFLLETDSIKEITALSLR